MIVVILNSGTGLIGARGIVAPYAQNLQSDSSEILELGANLLGEAPKIRHQSCRFKKIWQHFEKL